MAAEKSIDQPGFHELQAWKDALTVAFAMRIARVERIIHSGVRSGEEVTEVCIRVGLAGDEALFAAILVTTRENPPVDGRRAAAASCPST